jgi:hypothetical protein
MMIVTIDCKKQIRYKTTEYLRHESVFTSCGEVVDFKMAFPPAEEYFDVPSELIDGCDFFRREVKPVRDNPVYFIINAVIDNPQFLFRLIKGCSSALLLSAKNIFDGID